MLEVNNQLYQSNEVNEQTNTKKAKATNKSGTVQNTSNKSETTENQKDSLNISTEAMELLQNQGNSVTETSNTQNQGDTLSTTEMLQQYMDQLKESNEDAEKQSDDYIKIMEIARRISRGDKVPASDERKLMEYNSKLYQAAKTAAMLSMNRKHKRYKALFKDEKNSVDEKLKELERAKTESESVKESSGGDSASAGSDGTDGNNESSGDGAE